LRIEGVVNVSEGMGGVKTLDCRVRVELEKEWRDAAARLSEAVNAVTSDRIGRLLRPEYDDALKHTAERARREFESARIAVEIHHQEHGCWRQSRTSPSPSSLDLFSASLKIDGEHRHSLRVRHSPAKAILAQSVKTFVVSAATTGTSCVVSV
jgi:hypothetical protein